jgi:hypothetical protein
MSADQRVTSAREFLSGARRRKVDQLPPSLLMRECAELRRLLGQVLDVLAAHRDAAAQLAEIRDVLDRFDWSTATGSALDRLLTRVDAEYRSRQWQQFHVDESARRRRLPAARRCDHSPNGRAARPAGNLQPVGEAVITVAVVALVAVLRRRSDRPGPVHRLRLRLRGLLPAPIAGRSGRPPFEPEEDPGVARYCPVPLKVAICMTQSPDWGAVAL